jgi:bifunctional UDP-N-acetylglucosamine pyrophosphorylase / glucosamine-1-phosphate N-acetyltransferase
MKSGDSRNFCLGVSSRAAPDQVLTQDVPDDALALGRSRQVVKQGWATRLRGLKALGKGRKQ